MSEVIRIDFRTTVSSAYAKSVTLEQFTKDFKGKLNNDLNATYKAMKKEAGVKLTKPKAKKSKESKDAKENSTDKG